MKKTNQSTVVRRQQTAEKLWLLYFNQTLFEKGMISERDRNRMIQKIEARTPSTGGSRSSG